MIIPPWLDGIIMSVHVARVVQLLDCTDRHAVTATHANQCMRYIAPCSVVIEIAPCIDHSCHVKFPKRGSGFTTVVEHYIMSNIDCSSMLVLQSMQTCLS